MTDGPRFMRATPTAARYRNVRRDGVSPDYEVGQREGEGKSPFICVGDVAERLHCSKRTVWEMTRLRQIPHRVIPGTRRCLFLPDELRAWEDGHPLETIELTRGGRVVRPVASTARIASRPGTERTSSRRRERG